jgi:branched-chain amino acid transport system substrate-binding protein
MKVVRFFSFFAAFVSLMVAGMMALQGPSAGAATKSPIVIGYVGDLTGVAASDEADGLQGAEAAIDAQNAAGGVNGHKLELVSGDTQSSPSQAVTAVNELISKGAFSIIEGSALFFEAAKTAQQAGVPVVGYGIDGPEWLNPPYTNLFDVLPTPVIGPIGTQTYAPTAEVIFMKKLGVTKLAIFTYGISPSAVHSEEGLAYAAKQSGLTICYENLNESFGSVDFTSDVLAMKQNGCNGYATAFATASDVGMAQSVKNAGLTMKAQVLSEAYANAVVDNAGARGAVDGDYVGAQVNFTTPNPAIKKMLSNIKKVDPTFTGIPDLGLWSAYISAEATILGLEHAGANPTRSAFMKNLRKVTDFTASGILSVPTTFAHFGTVAMLGKAAACTAFVQLKGSKYIAVNGGAPICGKLIKVPASAFTS